MEVINETGTGLSISKPTDFTSPKGNLECYVASFNNFVLGFICSSLIVIVLLFIFLFIMGYIIKRNEKQASGSNATLRYVDVMDGGNNAPPSYSKYLSTSEEDNALLPS